MAVGFLLLDAVLLGTVALWDDRPGLLVWSGLFVILAGGVVLLRSRYRKQLDEIAQARARLRRELRALTPDRSGEGRT